MQRRRVKWDALGRRTDKVKARERGKMERLKLREGLSDSEIAKRLSRDPRTVHKQLELAEQGKEKSAKITVLDTAQTHQLIQKWLEQLQEAVPSPAQLLRQELAEIPQETLHRQVTSEDTRKFYYQSMLPHLRQAEGLRPVPLEQDPLYYKLRREFPASPAWPSYDRWQQQFDPYLSAFVDWSSGVENLIMLFRKELEEATKDTNLALKTLKFTSLCLCCDLLARGIRELVENPRWVYLVFDLMKLRADVCLLLSSLAGQPQLRDWPTDADTIWANSEDPLGFVKSTRILLDELSKFWSAQDRLVVALRELETGALSANSYTNSADGLQPDSGT